MIVIIDFGMGNLRSVEIKIKKFCKNVVISSDKSVISDAEKIILPGVGAFKKGMENIKNNDFEKILNKKIIKEKTSILGICLGMQLLSESSEEGNIKGLSWIKGKTKKFSFQKEKNFKIPHVGWNSVDIKKSNNILFKGVPKETYFYFTHSYHLVCKNKEDILSTTNYGYDFISSIHRENIYGTQFHPEKSHRIGMKIIQNFVEQG